MPFKFSPLLETILLGNGCGFEFEHTVEAGAHDTIGLKVSAVSRTKSAEPAPFCPSYSKKDLSEESALSSLRKESWGMFSCALSAPGAYPLPSSTMTLAPGGYCPNSSSSQLSTVIGAPRPFWLPPGASK